MLDKEELQKKIPLLAEEAAEAAKKIFLREQGGDHLAMGEVLAAFADLPRPSPPPTRLPS